MMTPFPPFPTGANNADFIPRAALSFGAMPLFADELNFEIANINAQAVGAVAAGTLAAAARDTAQALANYKGLWTALAGALAIPASTFHSGKFWALTANVANVALEVPGVSLSWQLTSMATGTQPGQSPRNLDLGAAAYIEMQHIYAEATFDPASVATAAQTSTTVTVPGAELGDFVQVTTSISTAGLLLLGTVTALATVTVLYANLSGAAVDLASHTLYVRVDKRIPK